MKKLTFFLVFVLAVLMVFSGCGAEKTEGSAQGGSAEKENGSGGVDQEILVVSFGTSYNDTREKTIGAIENAIQFAFPQSPVKRAFTSQTIIDKLAKRDGTEIDNVTEALDRAVEEGVKTLIVQPTHLTEGYEYADLKEELKDYSDKFEKTAIGAPLLASDSDFETVAEVLAQEAASYDDGKTAVCFMGHGTEADSNSAYAKLQEALDEKGYENCLIGTAEADPSLEDVMAAVKKGGYTRVVLQPLMVVAGDHAANDMAGDGDDSWKSQFEAAGYEVECVMKGLGELKGIQDLYAEHVRAAVESLA